MSTKLTIVEIPSSASLEEAGKAFLDEIGDWVGDAVDDLDGSPATDVHDQCTFTTAWGPYLRARPDERATAFLKDRRDRIRSHFERTDKWRHGYWRMQEAHHGTEHFADFLAFLWRLDPSDGETVRQFIDAAEHFGNWADEIPAWFDWDSGLYRSMWFGTDGVREEAGAELNVPDHFRCVCVALIAHEMTGEPRYLELAVRHAGVWADAVCARNELPVGLSPAGAVCTPDEQQKGLYASFSCVARGESAFGADVARAENLLASGAVGALLELWSITEDGRFRRAAERVLDVIATQLADPDAGAGADAIRCYRRSTGDNRYDEAVLAACDELRLKDIRTLAIEPEPAERKEFGGIGKRHDTPNWFEDGRPRSHNPITLALLAEIRQDAKLATRAIDLARAYFRLGRQVYPHGDSHGCSARTISAVARGHGRENGAGVVTAVLAPLMECFAPGGTGVQ